MIKVELVEITPEYDDPYPCLQIYDEAGKLLVHHRITLREILDLADKLIRFARSKQPQ